MTGQQEGEGPGVNGKVKEFIFPSRKAPARSTTQAAHVRDRKYDGSTAAMAAAYNVSPRTVSRWIDGSRTPKKHADQLKKEATEVQTTERGRERRARELERRGSDVGSSGMGATVPRVGTFEIRGSNATRNRDIGIALSGKQAAELARTMDEAEIKKVIGQGIAHYMNGGSSFGGFRADDFEFDVNSVSFKGI
ncbi:hypothetical protein [Streptomyces sp. NBC_01304]|uniref:hypothetical protein n=1 Tax=Streptomyces sp. NBC_01304 TaxID=2903818 RepID=UPI002E13FCFB|nr:hypothetical protein OG430_47790 [Streptomyces sp. NBC_01304]